MGNYLGDVEQEDGKGGFAMEFVKGENLEDLPDFKYRPGAIMKLARDLAVAVKGAHNVGVMHRDIKSDQIIHDQAADKYHLLDFGIGVSNDGAHNTSWTTWRWYQLGPCVHLGPELFLESCTETGDATWDERRADDVWQI